MPFDEVAKGKIDSIFQKLLGNKVSIASERNSKVS